MSPPEARTTRLFVDGLEPGEGGDTVGMARVLAGEQVLLLPLPLLPDGVREGDWVQVSVGIIPAPSTDTDAIRARLAKDDPGGTIKL